MSSIREQVRKWLHEHLISPMIAMTWIEKLISVFIGFWFGVFPIPGASTPILLAALFLIDRFIDDRLTTAEKTVCTAINLLCTPIIFLLLPIWIHLGQILLGNRGHCDVGELISEFKSHGMMQTLSDFTHCLVVATFAWGLYTPVVISVALIFRGSRERIGP